ncbi:urokinase plasminogen activator surface receptor-like [Scyliorhinus canicula]|uniref:urokinase plasminogen activator surface receptor-like n=1 Tax=Scyliorhinus canicula TaxID=7830 RepID=UPI0018F76BA8|nr:urokinase plasminogen activator surface receptor-like [Scyliorhinus canicula]
MKLLFVIAIVCSCITEVRSSVCYKCSGTTCSGIITLCLPSSTCQTTSITRSTGAINTTLIEQGCPGATQEVSFTSRLVFGSKNVKSCNGATCNTATVADPSNRTQNGLECYGCFNSTSNSCATSEEKVKCVGQEDRCFNGSGTQSLASFGSSFFAKGCVTQNVCNGSANLNDFLVNLDAQTKCCQGNLCNVESAPPVNVRCWECSGKTCNQSQTLCPPLSTCQTTSITRSTGGINTTLITQGCPEATQEVSFTSCFTFGSKNVKSCNGANCNTATVADPSNRTQNGLECYGCFNSTSDSCATSQIKVKCVGQEDRCFYGSGTQSLASFGSSFFAKGCVTQNVCNGSVNLNDFLVSLDSQTSCCQGNLCNSGSAGLQVCNQCSGTTCNPTTVLCPSSSRKCETVSISQFVGTGTKTLFQQKCAGTDEAVSFTSRTVSGSRDSIFCNSRQCNTQTPADAANRTFNGLQCSGCFDSTLQSCINAQQNVNCVGHEIRCFTGSGTQNLMPQSPPSVTIKGCITKNVCDGKANLNDLNINFNGTINCCAGSGCNSVKV